MADDHPGEPEAWAARFALLGDPTRLRLLIAMHDHPGLGVGELAQRAQVGENAASQALRVLREADWVRTTRDGRTVRYTLRSDVIVHRILHDILGVTHEHR
ncbi:ArsR/SmtB family transcription factor [Tsukamurella strandjordii]|uniref:Metalloregulator ArsR/SmtB family transcription factor n=1 Tax=Tsukamurella strandjordii TaxID=147577 RepID=A0AA90N9J6_9ACTN|nr:metalloregulator ArsR/SmtB family transcription factor [Tsukamurella strandjordii]MDP0397548.1 metalloregulator ArsR/SmtB family transcription factor [Tsukamurella strandjordii]